MHKFVRSHTLFPFDSRHFCCPPPFRSLDEYIGVLKRVTPCKKLPWNLKDPGLDVGVSENSGTPKSSILIGFSIINHPFWSILGYLYFWKHPCLWVDFTIKLQLLEKPPGDRIFEVKKVRKRENRKWGSLEKDEKKDGKIHGSRTFISVKFIYIYIHMY